MAIALRVPRATSHSIRSSSFLTLSRSGISTFLSVNSACGVASSFSLIEFGLPKFPSPVNTLGNSRLTSLGELYVASNFYTSYRAVRAGRPSKSFFNPLTTNITSRDERSLYRVRHTNSSDHPSSPSLLMLVQLYQSPMDIFSLCFTEDFLQG